MRLRSGIIFLISIFKGICASLLHNVFQPAEDNSFTVIQGDLGEISLNDILYVPTMKIPGLRHNFSLFAPYQTFETASESKKLHHAIILNNKVKEIGKVHCVAMMKDRLSDFGGNLGELMFAIFTGALKSQPYLEESVTPNFSQRYGRSIQNVVN
jgi:hypothetical protein